MLTSTRPKSFAHVVYRTDRFDEMLDWYVRAFCGKVKHQSPVIAFVTYNDEHPRVTLSTWASSGANRMAERRVANPAVDHVAHGYWTLTELLYKYAELKVAGLLAYWCIHHGITVSMYYADPDGNQMEFQADRYTSNDDGNAFMGEASLEMNPNGWSSIRKKCWRACARGIDMAEPAAVLEGGRIVAIWSPRSPDGPTGTASRRTPDWKPTPREGRVVPSR